MTRSEVLVGVMDDAARRVLSGTERPYVVAMETSSQLVHIDPESESAARWGAYILWIEITDVVDFLDGPGTEDLCDEIAAEISRSWLALANREVESTQEAFMAASSIELRNRVERYRASYG